ncbi:phosphotransferase enzyme family protein [Treponema bryantii]|uniref:phosphotransferase enzyme family protein n=1 Tax=Treponema bryantii TaxID=163 RepID=UPI0003B774AC|nr:phosphotransferase [Treponema bryantii]
MKTLKQAIKLFSLEDFDCHEIEGHEGGRNQIFICSKGGEKKFVLRISATGDRTVNDYRAEAEFVRYLAKNGAPVADVIPSADGKLVEIIDGDCTDSVTAGDGGAAPVFISLFEYAKGMLLADNGYRYRDGAPLSEYFFNTGKTLGKIHALSKVYEPVADYRRLDYFDKYNMEYLGRLIPDKYSELKSAISARLETFCTLPTDSQSYGLVHFDFSDGNYHIDMTKGNITVFDFDNCMYCWYMFDLANLWLHNEGWCRHEADPGKRFKLMQQCFDLQLQGYKTETEVPDELQEKLPLFIDMVLIENIVDEFECAAREGQELDYEDIEDAAECLINGIPYAGFKKRRHNNDNSK